MCGRQTVSRMPARRRARIENVLSLPGQPLVQLDLHAAHELHARQVEVHVGACTPVLLDSLPALVGCVRAGSHIGMCTSVLPPCMLNMFGDEAIYAVRVRCALRQSTTELF